MPRIIVETNNVEEFLPLIKGALENETKILSLGISKTKKVLKAFEKKYKMHSNIFYKKYEKGKMGDATDWIRWAGEWETLRKLQEDYRQLKNAKVCS